MNNIRFQKYPAYKDSGVDWIGMLPKHWEVKRLKYVLNELNVRSESGTEELLSLSKYNGIIPKSSLAERSGAAESLVGYKVVKENHLVINKMQAVNGLIAVSKLSGITSPDYSIYFVKDESTCNVDYICHLILQPQYLAEFKRRVTGVMEGFIRLYTDDLYDVSISLPPIEEQTAIAAFLDEKTAKIDRAISQKEKMIALLKERKQIIIQELVTGKKVWNEQEQAWTQPANVKHSGVDWIGEIPEHWEVKRLKNTCNINLNSLPENTPKSFSFNYVDIGSVSFENGIERTEFFEFKNAPSRARRIAKKGNTVISTVRTYLKAIDYISEEKAGFIYSTGFAVLESQSMLDKFLYHFVRSNAFTEQVTVDSKGMSYPAINSSDLSRLFLAIPPIIEQSSIVARIETQSAKIDKAMMLQQRQIEKLKELKATLIDSAVTGKICVFVPSAAGV